MANETRRQDRTDRRQRSRRCRIYDLNRRVACGRVFGVALRLVSVTWLFFRERGQQRTKVIDDVVQGQAAKWLVLGHAIRDPPLASSLAGLVTINGRLPLDRQ